MIRGGIVNTVKGIATLFKNKEDAIIDNMENKNVPDGGIANIQQPGKDIEGGDAEQEDL